MTFLVLKRTQLKTGRVKCTFKVKEKQLIVNSVISEIQTIMALKCCQMELLNKSAFLVFTSSHLISSQHLLIILHFYLIPNSHLKLMQLLSYVTEMGKVGQVKYYGLENGRVRQATYYGSESGRVG